MKLSHIVKSCNMNVKKFWIYFKLFIQILEFKKKSYFYCKCFYINVMLEILSIALGNDQSLEFTFYFKHKLNFLN